MQFHYFAADYLNKARTHDINTVSHQVRRSRWTLQSLKILFTSRERARTEIPTSTPCPQPC